MQLKQIAIIEDNESLIDFVKEYLKSHGDYQVTGYTSGTKALETLKVMKPDLVLIDLGLEDIRGETICVELRKSYEDLPIIILTGDKTQESIISCLNSGADDYITKPFNAEELVARIKARLRNVSTNPSSNILTSHDLVMNLETLEVTRNGKKIDLTAKEFELLKFLLMNKARIITRDKLLNSVWGYNVIVDTRVVDVHVGKLRRKIDDGFNTKLIETSRGFGYKLND